MKKKRGRKKMSFTKFIYLIDPARGTYDEVSYLEATKRLNRCESFVKNRAKDHELIAVDGRGYYLCEDLGDVWDLL